MSTTAEEHTKMQSTFSGDKREMLTPEKNDDNQDQELNEDHNKDQEHDQEQKDLEIIARKVKNNGFAWPLHPFQIISYFVILLDTYAFFFINMVTFAFYPALSAVLGAIYLGVLIAVVIYGYKATRNDPTDPTIHLQREAYKLGEYFDNTPYQYYCEVCDSHVQDDAKHCGQCNRCVSGFDHHCRWLNNCIGGSNYRDFFILICLVFGLTVIHNIIDAAVLFYINTGDQRFLDEGAEFYQNHVTSTYNVILAMTLCFNTAAIGFLGHLISFHIYLQNRKMTTFEYIQWKTNRLNHKSKIFREVTHGDDDKKFDEPQAEIETDNNQQNLQFHQIGDDESLIKEQNKLKLGEDPINSVKSDVPLQSDPKLVQAQAQKEKRPNKFSMCRRKYKKPQASHLDTQMDNNNYSSNHHVQLQSSSEQLQQNSDRSQHGQSLASPMGSIIGDNMIKEKQRSVLSSSSDKSTGQMTGSKLSSAENSKLGSPQQLPLPADNHILAVIKFGAADDQQHVQQPLTKQQSLVSKSRRDFQKILNRNKSELETIQERVKEEDVAAQSASNVNFKHIDVEESYSFSLRNYQGHKNSVFSNVRRNDNVQSSQSNNRESEDVYASTEQHNYSQNYGQRMSQNTYDYIDGQIREARESVSRNLSKTAEKPGRSSELNRVRTIKDNFVEQKIQNSFSKDGQQSAVIQLNRFSSHNAFVIEGGNSGENSIKNVMNDSKERSGEYYDFDHASRQSNLPSIQSTKTLGSKMQANIRIQNQWVNSQSLQNINQLDDIAESIISADEEYSDGQHVSRNRPDNMLNVNSFAEVSASGHLKSQLTQSRKSFA